MNRAGFSGGPVFREDGGIETEQTLPRFAPEVRKRTVPVVLGQAGEHASQRAAIRARRGRWRTPNTVELATQQSVDRVDHRRLIEPIGNIPPAEAETHHHARTEDAAMAA